MSEELTAQLMQLRALTRMTGAIHEAQALQLKYWPLIALPHATRSEVSFEVTEKNTRTVFIDVVTDPKVKPPKNLSRRLALLETNVKWLLGNDWRVLVNADGKRLFSGKRTAEPRPRPKRGKV
jgi:hypothetical protein